jgi:hypothetical protein
MSDTTQPENVIPLPVESSPAEQPQQPASDVTSTPAAEPTDLPPPTDANTIDLATITHEDIINRVMDAVKKVTFELLLALKLHEHIMVRDNPELAAQAQAQAEASAAATTPNVTEEPQGKN